MDTLSTLEVDILSSILQHADEDSARWSTPPPSSTIYNLFKATNYTPIVAAWLLDHRQLPFLASLSFQLNVKLRLQHHNHPTCLPPACSQRFVGLPHKDNLDLDVHQADHYRTWTDKVNKHSSRARALAPRELPSTPSGKLNLSALPASRLPSILTTAKCRPWILVSLHSSTIQLWDCTYTFWLRVVGASNSSGRQRAERAAVNQLPALTVVYHALVIVDSC